MFMGGGFQLLPGGHRRGFDRADFQARAMGHEGVLRREFRRLAQAAGHDDPVAADDLLGLAEGAVGGDAGLGDDRALGQQARSHLEAPLTDVLLEPAEELSERRIEGGIRSAAVALAAAAEGDVFLHGFGVAHGLHGCRGGKLSNCRALTASRASSWSGAPAFPCRP
jgi:hypothetical protein